jgi:hypothetical protein
MSIENSKKKRALKIRTLSHLRQMIYLKDYKNNLELRPLSPKPNNKRRQRKAIFLQRLLISSMLYFDKNKEVFFAQPNIF